MLAMQMQEAAMILMADSEVNWAAMPLCGVYDTRTGPLVMVGAFKPNPLRDICAALEIDDLSADPRYCDLTQQFKNKAALQAIFRERYAGNTREHWLARLEAVDILCSPVRDLREALVDPQTLHNQMLIEGDGEGQRVRFINSPITMSSARVSLRRAPPRLGQHNEDVLRELAQGRTPRQGGAMSVHLRIENHVATVTLARPDVLNAVDLATEAALQRIWTEIEGRDDVRVVVLTGEGERAFCVGADLKNPPPPGWNTGARRALAASAASRCARP